VTGSGKRRRAALATAAAVAQLEDDDRALLPALAAHGIDAVPAVWTDEGVDWAAYDGVLVRSTWDYAPRRAQFVDWASRVEAVSTLLNTAATLAWNTDKRYLRVLAERGVPVVPTTWLEPGDEPVLPDHPELVVKPAVSAGARDSARYARDEVERARRHAGGLLAAGRTVMVQPYVTSLDRRGETALVYLGGAFSHAVRKGPLLRRGVPAPDGLYAPEDISPRQETASERRAAEAVLAALPQELAAPVYARVDLVAAGDGTPLLLELELSEPSLFLRYGAGAAAHLAASVAAHLRGHTSSRNRV
jgi:hypothetical protein